VTGAAILRGNACAIPLADESVDLIVTSPPYFALRSYQDDGEHYDGQIGSEPTPLEFLEALWRVTAECRRVLKPTGSIFVNLGDKYAGSGGHNNDGISPKSTLRGNGHVGGVGKAGPQKIKATRRSAPDRYSQATIGGAKRKSLMGLPWRYAIGCIDDLGLLLRAELIWSKPNGLPESASDRVHRRHEQWFHFTKEPDYFCSIDDVREPHDPHTLYCAKWEADQGGYERTRRNPDRVDGGNNTSANPPHPLGKIPGSVWSVASQPLSVPDHIDVDHFAPFPREWPRRLILGWSPVGGVVLDPFGGTGTTAMAARALDRFGVSLDLSADYLRLARWRIFESEGASKIREATNAERQTDLFAGAIA
jgi:site-specific DNA-methyltransferase (cytosine-N4-specific)